MTDHRYIRFVVHPDKNGWRWVEVYADGFRLRGTSGRFRIHRMDSANLIHNMDLMPGSSFRLNVETDPRYPEPKLPRPEEADRPPEAP